MGAIERRGRRRGRGLLAALLAAVALISGCVSPRGTPEDRDLAARELFEFTTRTFHLPSAEATGSERERLWAAAEEGYRRLVREYPDRTRWAAQALRSWGNLCAARGDLERAVRKFGEVGEDYPEEEWEVLMAWKTAADLLWEAGRREEARGFYDAVVRRFNTSEMPSVVRSVVRGSKSRLAEWGGVGGDGR